MRRRLLVSLTTLVLMLLFVEGAVRVRQYLKFGTSGQRYHQLEEHEASGLLVPKAGTVTGAIAVNDAGFRSPDIPLEKPTGLVRLAFLGGSTTFCAEVSGNEATWPQLVVDALREAYPGVAFDHVNGGTAGYTTKESLKNLQHRVAPFAPDVVVVYHGTNDLVHATREIAIAEGLVEPDSGDEEGWLARNSMAWFLLRKNLRFRSRQANAAEGAEGMPLEAGVVSAAFAADLGALLDASADAAEFVVLPTFSTRIRPEQSREERMASAASALYYMPYLDVDQILAGYDEVNATLRALGAARPEVLLVEGEDGIPADDLHFADTVHFRDAGARKQADRVIEALLGSEQLAALVDARRPGN